MFPRLHSLSAVEQGIKSRLSWLQNPYFMDGGRCSMCILRNGEQDFSSVHWKETQYLVASYNGQEHRDLHRNPDALLRHVWQPLQASVSRSIWMSCTWHESTYSDHLGGGVYCGRDHLALTYLDKYPTGPSSFPWSHAHHIIFQWLIWFPVYLMCFGYWKWISESINECVCVRFLYPCLLSWGSLCSLLQFF